MPPPYHTRVPRTLRENLEFRRRLIALGRRGREYELALAAMCERDIRFWIDAFVWQYNPNSIGTASLEVGPFVTWDFQADAVERIQSCIARRRDLVIEKSREMGASWLCLLVMLHGLLFKSNKKYLCVSRNEKAVDDREDSDSLFWKLDFVLARLPGYMTAGITRKELTFVNERLNSRINGQAPTKKAGVGGRATAMFCDEFSQIDAAYDILGRTADTTGCRIFNGTHIGTQTAFYELTDPTSAIGSYVEKLQMHWTLHPDKRKGLYRYDPGDPKGGPAAGNRCQVVRLDPDYRYPPDFEFQTDGKPVGGPFPGLRSPWYDAECPRRGGDRQVAQDLDIDPTGSAGTLFDGVMVKSLIGRTCRPHRWEGDVLQDPDDPGIVTLSERQGGPLRLWCLMPDGRAPQDRYACGVDNSHGTGATPSCASIVNSRGEKVAEWVRADDQAAPRPMADLFVPLLKLFADAAGTGAMLCWEQQGPGATFGLRVIELGYRRVYYRFDEFKLKKKVSDAPGWNSTPSSKDALIIAYRDALRDFRFVNRSKRALEHTMNFVFMKDGHIEHAGAASTKDLSGARENHGDIVIADALAWKALVYSGGLAEPADDDRDKKPSFEPMNLARRRALAHNAAKDSADWCQV